MRYSGDKEHPIRCSGEGHATAMLSLDDRLVDGR